MPSAGLWRRTWGGGFGRFPRPGGRSGATGRSSLTLGAAEWRSNFPWGERCTCCSRQACHRFSLRPPLVAVAKPFAKTAPKPPPQKSSYHQYGSYTSIRYVLRHFGGELATEQRGLREINVSLFERLFLFD